MRFILGTIFLATLLSLSSCKGQKEKYLTQTWKLDDMQYVTPIPPEMEGSVHDIIEQQKAGYALTYFPDGTYEASMNGQKLKGTWRLNWNAGKLTVVGSDGQPKTYNITELTADKYCFTMRIPAMEKGGSEQEIQFFMSAKK